MQTSNASILQQSQQAIVDYNRFNLPEGSSVNFIQPNADAAILNRITGADPSFLNGTINANGQVYFVNPAGVTFGPDSVVRADMFMAIAGDMANSSFLRGEMNFLLGGTVENQGYIEAQRGVALLGRQVRNTGQIVAENGFAVLASGEEVLLQPNGTSLAVQVTDSRGQDPAGGIGVENLGEVNGEEIMFSAGDAFATAIRHEGSARAGRSARVHSDGGRIEVSGEILAGNQSGGGRIEVGGTDQGGEGAPAASSVRVADSAVLDASAPGAGDGGHVVVWSDGQTEMYGSISALAGAGGIGGYAEVSGHEVIFGPGGWNIMLGSGGHFLLDPVDIVIDATRAGSIISTLTAGTNVTLLTTSSEAGGDAGNITVASAIEVNNVSNQGILSLIADNDIIVNAALESAQPIASGVDVFNLTAGNNIDVNANIRAGTGALESQGAVSLTAGGSITLDGSIDSSNGPLSIRATDDITLQSGKQLLAGGSGSGLRMDIVSDTGSVVFDGGVIQLFGDTDLYIEAEQFLNRTGSNLVGGPGTGSWNIVLPHPLGRTSVSAAAEQHQYGSLNSLNPAQFNHNSVGPVTSTQNEYRFAFQPLIDITANDAIKTYGNDATLALAGFTPDTSDLVDASAFGSVFTQDTLQTVIAGTASVTSTGSSTTADVGTYPIEVAGFTFPNGYGANYINGLLEVQRRAVTLTASQQARTYGDSFAFEGTVGALDGTAFTVSDQGIANNVTLPNGETISQVSLVSANDGGNNTDLNAGTYSDDLSITQDTLVGAGGFDAGNYVFTYLPGDLVVDPRPVNVTAKEQDKYYGDIAILDTTAAAFTIADGGNADDTTLPNGDAIISVLINSETGKAESQVSDADTYVDELRITGVTGNSEFLPSNYDITYIDGDFEVTQRPIALEAEDQNRFFGDTLDLGSVAFTITDNGNTDPQAPFELPNGETIESVALTSGSSIAGDTTANAGLNPGNVTVSNPVGGNGFRLSNYDITFVTGDLTVDPRPITLEAGSQERIYGDPLTLDETVFSVLDLDGDATLPNGEVIDTVNLVSGGGVDQDTTASAQLYLDNLTITGQNGSVGFDATNYVITSLPGNFEIARRPVVVTATQQERTYGDPLTLDETAFSVLDLDHDAALPHGEVIDTVNLVSAGGVDQDTTANAGTYVENIAITGQNGSNGFEAGNYDLSYVANNLVVNQRAVTLTALQQERTYGDPLALDGTAFSVLDLDGDASLPNGEGIDTVNLVSAGGVDQDTTASAGTYVENIAITGQNGSNGFEADNYDLSYVANNLVVNQRAVTLTALQQERTYGDPLTLD
ncbi:MAG TPA: filamentous hemagglutinin N-terminal domain-containing protein, partial [Roseibacillus sp.]|nr:filamentous hemagglutinin N-terminal domain-containing protein [Roseibacillus sp.]